jgi:hypothetical protein
MQSGALEEAEKYFVKGGQPGSAVDMYLTAGRWEACYAVARQVPPPWSMPGVCLSLSGLVVESRNPQDWSPSRPCFCLWLPAFVVPSLPCVPHDLRRTVYGGGGRNCHVYPAGAARGAGGRLALGRATVRTLFVTEGWLGMSVCFVFEVDVCEWREGCVRWRVSVGRVYVPDSHTVQCGDHVRRYLIADEAELAINMYKKSRQYDHMIRLVRAERPDLVKDTFLHLAQQQEMEGNFKVRPVGARWVEGLWRLYTPPARPACLLSCRLRSITTWMPGIGTAQ